MQWYARVLYKKLRKHCHSRCTQKTWHRSMEVESWSGDVKEEMGCSGKYLTAILRKYNKLLLHWMMNTTIHMPNAREHRPRNSSHMKIRITVDVTLNTTFSSSFPINILKGLHEIVIRWFSRAHIDDVLCL